MTTPHERFVQHAAKWANCQECPLCTQRDKIVLARGVVPCDVMFLGEAPGESENSCGLPFWGPAGDKLEEIVAHVRSTCRVPFTEAYANLVCCFPREAKQTDDHRPEPEEIEACAPRLREFAEIARPKLVVCVGDTAKNWVRHLLGETGNQHWCDIIHPAAILGHMPQVQKSMAVQNCVKTILNAVELAMCVV